MAQAASTWLVCRWSLNGVYTMPVPHPPRSKAAAGHAGEDQTRSQKLQHGARQDAADPMVTLFDEFRRCLLAEHHRQLKQLALTALPQQEPIASSNALPDSSPEISGGSCLLETSGEPVFQTTLSVGTQDSCRLESASTSNLVSQACRQIAIWQIS